MIVLPNDQRVAECWNANPTSCSTVSGDQITFRTSVRRRGVPEGVGAAEAAGVVGRADAVADLDAG